MSSAYGTHRHVQSACAIVISCQDIVSALHRSAQALGCVRKVWDASVGQCRREVSTSERRCKP
eukprot:7612371-Pyramimonas_sp.AAC.1